MKASGLILIYVLILIKSLGQNWVPATPFPDASLGFSSGIGGGVTTGITCTVVFNNELYVGGNFTSIGGIVAHCIAKWNDNNWSAVGQANFLQNVYVSDMIVYQNKLYFTADKLYVWDGNSIQDFTTYDTQSQSYIPVKGSDLELHDNQLYVVNNSNNFTGLYVYDGLSFSTIFTDNFMGTLLCAESYNNTLYVGTDKGLFRFSGSFWTNCNGVITSDPLIYDIEVFNNELIVIGSFNTIGGLSVKNLAKYDGANWLNFTLPNGYYINPNVALGWFFTNHLNVIENELYVAHRCNTMQIPTNNPSPVIKYSNGQWTSIATNYSNGRVHCVTNYNGNLYCGGDFDYFSISPSFDDLPYSVGNFVRLQDVSVSIYPSFEHDYFSISPNPTSDFLNILLSNSQNVGNYTLTDQWGKIVMNEAFESNETVLNLSDLTQGVYFLSVEGINEVKRIIKH